MLTVCAGLALSGSAYIPAATAPAHQLLPAHSAATPKFAASRIRMNAGGGTETVDLELGKAVNDREVLDEDLLRLGRRARPNIDWSNLRARLEIEFKLSDEELKKYDEISKEDLLKSYVATQAARGAHSGSRVLHRVRVCGHWRVGWQCGCGPASAAASRTHRNKSGPRAGDADTRGAPLTRASSAWCRVCGRATGTR